jgi:hypothetical protein
MISIQSQIPKPKMTRSVHMTLRNGYVSSSISTSFDAALFSARARNDGERPG